MSILSWFTSGGKAVEKVTDALINGADALVLTKEEEIQYSEKRRDLYFKFLELSRDENSIKSVTRRIIAFAVIGQWLLMLNVCLGLYLYGDTEQAKFIFDMIKDMFWFVFAIGSFYFGAGIINKVKEK